ncbi:DNA/RNA nuclease SfsA [Treponema sp.]|uniref:DNA/RNA nuclease SfsA n=1 Tax=Treponema sp. TaxID=166 RepID=UPI0025D4B087|nr:DNA/RNA nuclease SfsA [Treponema sp.]
MQYSLVKKAIFVERPNRFIAHVLLNGKKETVHVKNTGRCKELLLPESTIYIEESCNPLRKTKYDLIAVEKGKLLINMDSQAPNKVAAEWIKENKDYFYQLQLLKSEYTLGDSRFDFYAEYKDKDGRLHKKLIEVKGCTLEKDGIAMFPDAPTLRGLKHVKELTALHKAGSYECMILIIVQMKGCKYFTPNRDTHPEFADALHQAKEAGLQVIAVECQVKPDTLIAQGQIEVRV